MRNGFTRGLIVGSIVGASLSMMMETGRMKGRGRRKMMNTGRNFMRQSGNMIGEFIEMFR